MNEKELVVLKTAGLLYRTKSIWQYDIGHTLRFDGFDLPDTFQVHFARSMDGESKTQIGQDSVCELPAEYTQNSGTIYAWVYVADEETGLTKHAVEIPVKARGAITDQEPTPAERSVIDQTIAALNTAVEKTAEAQQAAEDAAESVKNASATAETLSPGSPATVVVEDVEGVKTFKFGIPEGQKGETGDRGPQGERGEQGIQGLKGEKGDKGDTGATGQKGDKGDPGERGEKGDTGATGAQGPKGDTGETGAPGQDGQGVPPGGAAGQVLVKASGADNDTVWQDRTPTVSVSGTTPTINALPGVCYVCGEVSTLDIMTPATGIVDVVFTSGATPTVLTVPSTVHWPAWFDQENLDANTTYELNILNGYGAVMAWA